MSDCIQIHLWKHVLRPTSFHCLMMFWKSFWRSKYVWIYLLISSLTLSIDQLTIYRGSCEPVLYIACVYLEQWDWFRHHFRTEHQNSVRLSEWFRNHFNNKTKTSEALNDSGKDQNLVSCFFLRNHLFAILAKPGWIRRSRLHSGSLRFSCVHLYAKSDVLDIQRLSFLCGESFSKLQ